MIRIRYEDFSAGPPALTGLHGWAERCPRGVTVYLLPGLSTSQRSAVIRRLRQEASRGVGPALPLPRLALALGIDRLRSAARIGGAMVRLHPVVTLLPGACVVGLMTLFVVASASRSGGAVEPGEGRGLDAAAVSSGTLPVVSGQYVRSWPPGTAAAVPRRREGQPAGQRLSPRPLP